MKIERISELPADIGNLVKESEGQGFLFLQRLVQDFNSAENRFDQEGEALFAVIENGRCIGVGGINIDPYAGDREIGRVRRVYVSSAVRGRGAGKALMKAIEGWGAGHFKSLRLFTDTEEGAGFYERQGYTRLGIDHVSHVKFLRPLSPVNGDSKCVSQGIMNEGY